MKLKYDDYYVLKDMLGVYVVGLLSIFMGGVFIFLTVEAYLETKSLFVVMGMILASLGMLGMFVWFIKGLMRDAQKLKGKNAKVGQKVSAHILKAYKYHAKGRYCGGLNISYEGGEKKCFIRTY